MSFHNYTVYTFLSSRIKLGQHLYNCIDFIYEVKVDNWNNSEMFKVNILHDFLKKEKINKWTKQQQQNIKQKHAKSKQKYYRVAFKCVLSTLQI